MVRTPLKHQPAPCTAFLSVHGNVEGLQPSSENALGSDMCAGAMLMQDRTPNRASHICEDILGPDAIIQFETAD